MRNRIVLKKLLRYAKNYRFQILGTIFMMSIAVSIRMLEPYIIGISLDKLIYTNKGITEYINYIFIFVALIIAGNIINLSQTILLQKIGQNIVHDIRKDLFSHTIELDMNYHKNTKVGDNVSRITNDTDRLNEMFTSVFTNLFVNMFTIILSLSFMFYLHYELTLIVLCIVPLIFLLSFILRKIIRKKHSNVRKLFGKLNGFLSEHLSGIKTIQLFNQQQITMEKFKDNNKKLLNSYYKELSIYNIYFQVMYFVQISSTLLIILFGGISVIQGTFTVGILFSFTTYLKRFFNPIHSLSNQMNILESAFASADRIFQTIDRSPAIESSEQLSNEITGSIEFKNVWFAYDKENWILKDVSFKIKSKESVAFVGPTGAGKTTILSLIGRYYDIQKGEILIDGIDIRKYDKYHIRTNIGQMLQDVFLFTGTIEENLRLFDSAIPKDKMVRISKEFHSDVFIENNPDKYKQLVYENGANFSSGEKQLLSFTRTLLKDPNILVLDESTSSIDIETERHIQSALKKLIHNRTLIIIAHRLSTISNVDSIIVLKQGEIVEQGTHKQLIGNEGEYFKLYHSQSLT